MIKTRLALSLLALTASCAGHSSMQRSRYVEGRCPERVEDCVAGTIGIQAVYMIDREGVLHSVVQREGERLRSEVVQLPGRAIDIATTDTEACVLVEGGDVLCWGRANAQFCEEPIHCGWHGTSPTVVAHGMSELGAYGVFFCALDSSRSAWCWGKRTGGSWLSCGEYYDCEPRPHVAGSVDVMAQDADLCWQARERGPVMCERRYRLETFSSFRGSDLLAVISTNALSLDRSFVACGYDRESVLRCCASDLAGGGCHSMTLDAEPIGFDARADQMRVRTRRGLVTVPWSPITRSVMPGELPARAAGELQNWCFVLRDPFSVECEKEEYDFVFSMDEWGNLRR